MTIFNFIPAPFPGPPIPIRFPIGKKREVGEEVHRRPKEIIGEKENLGPERSLDEEFMERLISEGFNPKIVLKGVKLANTYSQSREKALEIGEEYIREVSK